MAAGSIIIDLLARTGSFVTDIDRSTKAAEKRLKEFQKAAAAAGAAIGASLAAAGAAAIYFGKQVVDGLDALNDVADATGASIENISALEDVALRTGASLDTVSTTLVKFNQVLNQADGKNAVSLALSGIGLEVENLKRLDPAEALRQVAVALNGYADDANKARLLQELFGKSVKDVVPYLKDLATQTELVGKVTAEQTAEAERFNKQLFELQANVIALARDIAGPLIKAINDTIQVFKDAKAAGNSFLGAGWDRYAKNVRDVYVQMGLLNEEIDKGASGSWEAPASPGAPAAPSLPDVGKLEAQAKKEEELRKAREKAAKDAATAAQKAQDDANRYIDSLNKQIAAQLELTEVERVLDDIAHKRIEFQNIAQAGAALAAAQRVDDLKAVAEAEKQATESSKRLADAQKQIAAEVAAINEATRSPQEEFNARVERLDELLDNGHLTLLEYTRALTLYKEQMADAVKKTGEGLDEMSKFAERAQENIQDALGNSLEQALSGNFDSIGKMWQQLLTKMVAQALAAQLNEQLFGGGKGNTNWLSTAFQAVATAYGGGTPLATGTNYVPYDNFPAMLHEGGAVVPKKYNPAANGGGALGAGKFEFVSTINVGSNVSRGEVAAAVKDGNIALEAKFRRMLDQRQRA